MRSLNNNFYNPKFKPNHIYWAIILIFHLTLSFGLPILRYLEGQSEVTPFIGTLKITFSSLGTVGFIGYITSRRIGKPIFWKAFFCLTVTIEVMLLLFMRGLSPMLLLGKSSMLQYILSGIYHVALFKYAFKTWPSKRSNQENESKEA
jgi:hypothetical protein